jgi:hypothetical protein
MKLAHLLSVPVTALALLGAAGTASAATPAALAKAHFRDIAAGRIDAVVGQYGAQPVFEWIGGPLDGRYAGAKSIEAVWKKFAHAQGKMKLSVTHVMTAANPAGATVTADVKFIGKKTIPVRYALTYRKGRLVDEIWQIDPKLGHM